jgi:hypothetical protein
MKGKPISTIDLSTEEAQPPLSLSFRPVRPPEEERGKPADERRLSRRFHKRGGVGTIFAIWLDACFGWLAAAIADPLLQPTAVTTLGAT